MKIDAFLQSGYREKSIFDKAELRQTIMQKKDGTRHIVAKWQFMEQCALNTFQCYTITAIQKLFKVIFDLGRQSHNPDRRQALVPFLERINLNDLADRATRRQ